MTGILLDLYCGEGGASRGYADAGFEVIGADLFRQHTRSRYPFRAVRGDVLDVLDALLAGSFVDFDGIYVHLMDLAAITASPPCQRYSITNAARRHNYPDLIGPTRERLIATGKPYVIENVARAPLHDPLVLCGSMFNLTAVDDDGTPLRMERHRLFESNLPLVAPAPCVHDRSVQVAGSYGGARRDKWEARHVRHGGYVPAKPVQQRLMGIDWMTERGMHQAIPPAYTRHIGQQVRAHIERKAAA